jgi:hypothetical protein
MGSGGCRVGLGVVGKDGISRLRILEPAYGAAGACGSSEQ